MENNTHKSVAIDMATYNILAEAAEAECRSISMQIKWLVRNSNDGSPRPTAIPVAPVVKRRTKRLGKKSMETIKNNPDTMLNKVLLKLYALTKRGDLTRIGNAIPYYYQLTTDGASRLKAIKERIDS